MRSNQPLRWQTSRRKSLREARLTSIRLLLPRGGFRRWHRALAESLTNDGHRVFVTAQEGASASPAALILLETLERLLYARGKASPSDPLPPGEWSPDEGTDEAGIVLDLTGAPDPAPGAIVPLFDGATGDCARDAALLSGRSPTLALARPDGAGWQVLAQALPAVERPSVLASGRDGVANRIIALARQLARGGPHALQKIPPRNGAPRAAPLRFFSAGLIDVARRRLSRLIEHEGHWRIGLRKLAPGQSGYASFEGADGAGWTWLPDDRQRYFADPFVFEECGVTYVFCEEYPYASGKGVISVFTLDAAGNAGEARIALERPYHLSYPNIFHHDGQIWMMPESSGARTLEVYRADPFPYRWILDRVVLRDVEISDATPFRWNDEWLLTGATNEPGASSWDCLSLFCGPSPLGPWSAIGEGPALIDASAARPAGNPFRVGGDLIRPAQDCSAFYGSGLAFCRIDEAGQGAPFRQTPIRRISPPAGIHTFNFTSQYLAIDRVGPRGRRAVFDRLARS